MRPTPDRVRETVFNWLAADIPGAQILDCFSGAGGLGLEAASREAAHVTLVEIDRVAANGLRTQATRLGAANVTVEPSNILDYLARCEQKFDVVFIDPPYAEPELRHKTLQILLQRQLLNPGAKLYLEWPANEEVILIQDDLTWVKQKSAGQLQYAIAQFAASG